MEIRSIALFCLATATAASIASTPLSAQLPSNATLYASKLEGPRGLKFGPDGMLYVAEAGTGGTTSTKGTCAQVIPPIGPYVNGNTARISKIDKAGNRTTVASGFPSSQSSDPTKDTSGVADVAFLGSALYAVLAGGGCSHGATIPNAVVKVDLKSGEWKIVADLSSFLQSHPAAYPNLPDFEPDGTFYSLLSYRDLLYTVEPNHGQVFSISPSGDVKEAIDISQAQGHIVPTSIVARDDIFYVGNLNTFPITLNASKILTLSKDPRSIDSVPGLDLPASILKVVGSRAGFATVVAVDIGPDGLLYALELSAAVGFPTPGDGKVVRLTRAGEIEDVVTGLAVPTGMTFGPDGFLYVSNWGAAPAGMGQILRISVP